MAYEVGYGRPPKRTQFKPGQSGNPKGRPRRRASIEVLLKESLFQQVTVMDEKRGVRRKVSLVKIIFQKVAQKAALGDPKPLMQVLRMMNMLPGLIARAEAQPENKEERLRELDAKLAEIFGEYVEPEPEGAPPPTQQRPPRKA